MKTLKVAILNPFPEAAEMGAARRMVWAASRIGVQSSICNNTDEVIAADPDFVIAMHHFVGKLTDHITFGYMCNPPVFFDEDPFSLRNILSYDGWLSSGGDVDKLYSDLSVASRKDIPSCDFIMSSHIPSYNPIIPKTESDAFDLCYVGANWDGPRFKELFEYLDNKQAIYIYGPSTAWIHCPNVYVGAVPCDGKSVFNVIRRHGIYLCLHNTEHRKAGIVNLRVFEGAAAGGVLICDNHPVIKKNFGESVYYVNMDVDAESIGIQIETIVNEINSDRLLAIQKATASHNIFKEKFAYEVILKNAIRLYHQVKKSRSVFEDHRSAPLVTYVVRAGLRPQNYLERCLESVKNQMYQNIEVVAVIVSSMFSQHDTIEQFRKAGLTVRIVEALGANRGAAFQHGLDAVKGKYFGIVDDDDVIFSDHTSTHVGILESNPSIAMSHGGAVRVWNGDRVGYLEHFDRKLCESQFEVPNERRRLNFFDEMTDELWTRMENVITSNSFLVRSDVVADINTNRCDIEVVEDYSLISEIWKSGRDIRQSWCVTSAHYWEDHLAGNVTFDRENYVRTQRRFRLTDRLSQVLSNYDYQGPSLSGDLGAPRRALVAGTQSVPRDRIGGNLDYVQVSENGLITLSGWIEEKNSSVGQALYLQLKNEGALIIKHYETLARSDVAEYFNCYDYYWSGFHLELKVIDQNELSQFTLFSYSSDGGWKKLSVSPRARNRLENFAMHVEVPASHVA